MLFDAVKLRILQADPIVHDYRDAKFPDRYRGVPYISGAECSHNCVLCADICPAGAVTKKPFSIDIGKCVFCGLCAQVCPENKITFTGNYHLASDKKENLIINEEAKSVNMQMASEKIRKYFGKSLKLRQVSAGGCNGCELELNALNNVNFDMGRFGVEFTASPRHADGIVITGPVTKNMAEPLEICYEALPHPKIVILCGSCAISGGIFQGSPEINRGFLEKNKIDLYIPGCPPHPLTFINGILRYIGR